MGRDATHDCGLFLKILRHRIESGKEEHFSPMPICRTTWHGGTSQKSTRAFRAAEGGEICGFGPPPNEQTRGKERQNDVKKTRAGVEKAAGSNQRPEVSVCAQLRAVDQERHVAGSVVVGGRAGGRWRVGWARGGGRAQPFYSRLAEDT